MQIVRCCIIFQDDDPDNPESLIGFASGTILEKKSTEAGIEIVPAEGEAASTCFSLSLSSLHFVCNVTQSALVHSLM